MSTVDQKLRDLYTEVDASTEAFEDSIIVEILLQWSCSKCNFVAPVTSDFESVVAVIKFHVESDCKLHLTSSELANIGTILAETGEPLTQSDLQKRQLQNGKELEFMFGGNSYVTFVNTRQNQRFTYKIGQAANSRDNNPPPHFIHTLTGQNNTDDYQFIGTVFHNTDGDKFRYSNKSTMTEDAPSVHAFKYVFEQLVTGSLANFIEIWHEGRCCVCGRVLTTPESIQKGIGPVCEGGRA